MEWGVEGAVPPTLCLRVENPDGWMAAVERLPWFAAEMGCEDVVVAFVEMVGVLSSCSHRGC